MALELSQQQVLTAIVLAIVSLVTWRLREGRSKPNLPPLVPYKWPILGSTFDFLKDPTDFTVSAYKKYGPVFRVNLRGHTQAVVGKDQVRDIFLSTAFSYEEAVKEEFDLADMLGTSKTKLEPHKLFAIVMTPYLGRFVPVAMNVLVKALQDNLGTDKKAPVVVDNVFETILDVMSRANAVCFFGEELGTNSELIPLFKQFAGQVGHWLSRKSPVLALFPTIAKTYLWVKFHISSPTAAYRNKVLKHALPIVNERRRQMREYGDSYNAPVDSLQAYINSVPLDQPIDEFELGTFILTLIFFSMHTTSKRTTYSLYNLAKYPQFIPDLLAEQEATLGQDWSAETVTHEQLKGLEKLDSFVRETLRTSNRSIALPHKIVGMDEWHLPGGYVLPKGTVVNINTEDIYYSPELQGPDPRTFNAWRFVGTDKSASRIGPDMVAFGLGRHTCPGRFFAVNEIKLALSLILRQYRISFPAGAQPSDSAPLVFTPIGAA
ncbi:cytochrome P450 [Wolfiporia cocos MD-104 SS10]|uniref:Cytochrome P450 n=1 Tax=Wolfiporia cocos (strain MD-104) TaxID=742152 RepID=A0A2H3JI54_WOLCO|nr:cytochrome P450 [Wolfiporia cocos MD-104 SS10]